MSNELDAYEYICEYRERHGYSPTVREISKAIAYKSTSTTHQLLCKMEHRGMIRKGKGARTVVPLPDGEWGER